MEQVKSLTDQVKYLGEKNRELSKEVESLREELTQLSKGTKSSLPSEKHKFIRVPKQVNSHEEGTSE